MQTIEYWPFSWQQFLSILPEDWQCVQLCMIRDQKIDMGIKIREREAIDLGCQAYLIKRNYAEKIVGHYLNGNKFKLDVPAIYLKSGTEKICTANNIVDKTQWWIYEMIPIVENVVFLGLDKVYICPLFVEDVINTNSTYIDYIDDCHQYSYDYVLNYWKNYGQNMKLADFSMV